MRWLKPNLMPTDNPMEPEAYAYDPITGIWIEPVILDKRPDVLIDPPCLDVPK